MYARKYTTHMYTRINGALTLRQVLGKATPFADPACYWAQAGRGVAQTTVVKPTIQPHPGYVSGVPSLLGKPGLKVINCCPFLLL